MLRFFMVSLAVAAIVVLASSTRADIIDLTTAGASGAANGAFFQQIQPNPVGSGVIHSFVRINPGGKQEYEQGYNTDGRKVEFDENSSPVFTRSLLLSDVPSINGHYQFLLDINETNSGDESLLSLNSIKIFLASTGDINHIADLGAPVWDLDGAGDMEILLDFDLNPGSGWGDMRADIPITADPTKPYVYLYSQFGAPPGAWSSSDGYEEWAHGTTAIPAPGAAVLGLLGLGVISWLKRRFA